MGDKPTAAELMDEEYYMFRNEGSDHDNMDDDEEGSMSSAIPSEVDPLEFVYTNIPDTTHILKLDANCKHCKAKKFISETDEFCCRNGQIELKQPEPIPELMRLWSSMDADSRHFRENIRFFNGHFAFTTLGVSLDENYTNMKSGVYTFRAHGSIYHNVHSFGPSSRPEHLQLYFYDDDPTITHQGNSRLCVSVRDYYCYMLQTQPGIFNPILCGARLLQQWAVDMYVKIESCRLRWYRKNQTQIRADLYKGVVDAITSGETRASAVGVRIVLPGTYPGGDRDMKKRHMDAMAIVHTYGKPDIFLTMTCNPTWEEITNELLPGQTAQDRPDIVARVFYGKLEAMKDMLFKKHILGVVVAYRRDDGRRAKVRGKMLDNRWVVPYNPYLLRMFNCHINVEVCSSIKPVKYLYKYIYKGHDKASFSIDHPDADGNIDEIKRYVDARVAFNAQADLKNVVASENNSKSMLTEYFKANQEYPRARHILYKDFPESFTWQKKKKFWKPRVERFQIGRIVSANPAEGDRYYLRVLLNHVTGKTSFDDLLTVDGVLCGSFREAAERLGLIEADNTLDNCLTEAEQWAMPCSLRRLFATILVHCEPSDVRG
ncbi:uncharacterized protein [Aegilops tauschii subsp. strangulata]|uniref:uncharacterized protein n=1 Tax=Aegilops tauschii subsp. strangulata TaxID=200361 RepID=UPI003CC869DB